MDTVRIRTTQNVDIEYQPASVGDRVLATLLDYLFMLAYVFIIGMIMGLLNRSGSGDFTTLLSFIMLVPIILYHLLCETFFHGKSFGKMIMKIQVVKLDGTPAHFSNYLLRWLLWIIDVFLFFGVIGLIVILVNGKGQRIGDIAASTTVIKIKQKTTIDDTILKTITSEYIPVFTEVSRLTDHDVAIIKEVLEFSIKNNNPLAIQKLAQKTKETMVVSTQLPDVTFLETVISDYNHFHFDK